MLHLDLEILSIKLWIETKERISILIDDGYQTERLLYKIKNNSVETQPVSERCQIDIPHTTNHSINIFFVNEDNTEKFAEATIGLDFYIDNNLPCIIDKLPIASKYDSKAHIEFCLTWNIDKNRIISKSPKREDYAEKRTVYPSYTKWHDQRDQLKIEHEKKLKERPKKTEQDEQINSIQEWEGSLRRPGMVNMKRYQTPKVQKVQKIQQQSQDQLEVLERVKQDIEKLQQTLVDPNKKSSPKKAYQNKLTNQEQDREIFTGPTKQKTTTKSNQNVLQNRETQVESQLFQPKSAIQITQALSSSKQDSDVNMAIPINNLKAEMQIIQQENQTLKTELNIIQLNNTTLKQDISSLQQNNNSLKSEVLQLQQNLQQQAMKQVDPRASQDVQQLQTINNNSQVEILSLKQQIQRLKDEILQEKQVSRQSQNTQLQELQSLQVLNNNYQQEIIQLKQQIQKLKDENQVLSNGTSQIQLNNRSSQDIQSQQTINNNQQIEIAQLKQQIQKMKDDMLRQSQNGKQSDNRGSTDLLQYQNTINNQKLEIQQLQQQILKQKEEFNLLQEKYRNRDIEYNNQQKSIQDLQNKIQIFTSENQQALKRQQSKDFQYQQLIQEIEKLQSEVMEYQKQKQLYEAQINTKKSDSRQPQSDVTDGLKDVIRQKIMIIDSQNQEIQQLKKQLASIEKDQQYKSNTRLNEVQNLQTQLREALADNQTLKRQIQELQEEISQKIQENIILNTKMDHYKQMSNSSQDIDVSKALDGYSKQIAQLQTENQDLNRSNLKNIILLEGQKQEIDDLRDLSNLNEQRVADFEKELFFAQEQLRQTKQDLADVLNTVLELGGVTYLERIENSMRFRNLANKKFFELIFLLHKTYLEVLDIINIIIPLLLSCRHKTQDIPIKHIQSLKDLSTLGYPFSY
ncbi:hypothetical protein pb186bvf_006018 [Paramecium bursaria]